MVMVMNFHNLLYWLQDIRFRSLKLLSPPPYTAPVLWFSEQDRGQKTAWFKCRNCYFSARKMFLSSPFRKWRTRKDWKAWKGKNEGRFLRALLRWRVQGVSKDKVCTDLEKKKTEVDTSMHKMVFSCRTRWQEILRVEIIRKVFLRT